MKPYYICKYIHYFKKAHRDNHGREFTIGFFDIPNDYPDVTVSRGPELHMTTDLPGNVNVIVTAPLFRKSLVANVTVTRGKDTVVKLPAAFGMKIQREHKGIFVQASDDIAVFVVYVNKKQGSAGGYMAIPNDCLGTGYIVASHLLTHSQNRNEFNGSAVGIIATETNTILHVRYPTRRDWGARNFMEIEIQNAFETYLFLNLHGIHSPEYDFTGLYVVSNKPIAVISGAIATAIELKYDEQRELDLVIEMMPPINTLSTFYVLPKMTYAVRIIATQSFTRVLNAGTEVVLPDRGWYVHQNSNESDFHWLSIRANKPILMVAFTTSKQDLNMEGDTSMVVIPPVQQWPSKSPFVSPALLKNKLQLMVRLMSREHSPNTKAGLKMYYTTTVNNFLDGNFDWKTIYKNYEESGQFQIDAGAHTIFNDNPTEIHAGLVIGAGMDTGYAFPIGWRFGITHVRNYSYISFFVRIKKAKMNRLRRLVIMLTDYVY